MRLNHIFSSILLLTTSLSANVFASTICSTLLDKSAVARTTLDAQGFLEIPAGQTWRLDGLELKNGERLFGKGQICKVASQDFALNITGTGVSVEGLTFAPDTASGQPNCDIKLADGGSDIRIMDNQFNGASYSAICAADDSAVGGEAYTQRVQGLMIADNVFTGYSRPVFLHSVDNLTINNNLFSDTLRDAVRLRENDGYALITGNQFFNIGDGVVPTDTQDAVDTYWGGNRLVISDNIIRTTQSMGLDIKGVSPAESDEGSRSVIISNNHISDTLYSGIVLHGNLDTGEINHSIIVEGNILEHNTRNRSFADAAIWVKGMVKYLTVANNQLISNYSRGITIQTRSGQNDGSVSGVHVTGNQLINNGVDTAPSSIGLFLLGVQNPIVTHNTVGNDAGLNNPHTRFGIYTSKISNAIVKNNILRCNLNSALTASGTNVIQGDNIVISTGC